MDLTSIVLTQVFIMALLIAVGMLANKIKFIDRNGNAQFTKVLLYIVTPCVIVNAFYTPFDKEKLKLAGISLALAIISHLIAITCSYIFIRDKNNGNTAIERFSMIYTNCGFMALPLLGALFSNDGVLYGSIYMVVFQILSWTHGYISISGDKNPKQIVKALFSPAIIAVVVGFTLFLTSFTLPLVVSDTIKQISNLNTPLAMIVIGVSLAQSNILKAFCKWRHFYVVLLGNFFIPLLITVIYSFLDFIPQNLILINIVSVACPCAATTLMMAQKLGKNEQLAGYILTLSNVATIVSLPFVVYVAQLLYK